MIALFMILAIWCVVGFVFARYVLGQKDWFTLIPSSVGIGMVLQVLVLNVLLHVIRDNAVVAYWISVAVLGGLGFFIWRWKRHQVEALVLGLSPRSFGMAWLVIIGLWAMILPGLWRYEGFDYFWHQPLASNIAFAGLPPQMPFNPDYCAFYHYAPDLLSGVVFRVTNASFATAFDWVDSWAVFATLGLATNVAWRISQRRSIWVGVLGMVIFFLGSHAGWVYVVFATTPVQDLTQEMAFFDHVNQYALSGGTANLETQLTQFSNGNFFNPYSLTLHTHSMNLAWISMLLTLVVLWDIPATQKRTWSVWFLLGFILGVMPLAFETLWLVPMGLVVFYGVYLLVKEPAHRPILLFHAAMILVPAVILGFGQGGAFTDSLVCPSEDLGEGMTGNRFPVGPGYYSWLGPEYVELTDPNNWLQAGIEWGLLIFCYPVLLYTAIRKRQEPLLATILVVSLLPVLGLLVVDLTLISFDSGRIATLPMMIWGLLLADWLDVQWQKGWGWRIGVAVLVASIIFGGAVQLYNHATLRAIPWDREINPITRSWMLPIDRDVQKMWWGEIGTPDDLILDLNYVSQLPIRYSYIRPTVVFGNYTFYHISRSQLSTSPHLYALKRCPDPQTLVSMGVKYIYLDEQWWTNVPAEGRVLLQDPEQFRLVFAHTDGEQFRQLYEVLDTGEEIPRVKLSNWQPSPDIYLPPPRLEFETGQVSFYPAFTPFFYNKLFGAVSETALAPEVQPFIQDWRMSKSPNALLNANIAYLVIDTVWMQYASEEEVALINDPTMYEKVGEWGFKWCTPVQIFRPLPQDED